MTDGRCLCGALRYQIDGPFVDMVHCHCSMCRKHHGAPFATWAVAPLSGFRWVGDTSTLASYKSSEKGHREFCRVCGSVAPLLDEAMPEFERTVIREALKATRGGRQEAAKLLGWGRNTLTRKLKELGMDDFPE